MPAMKKRQQWRQYTRELDVAGFVSNNLLTHSRTSIKKKYKHSLKASNFLETHEQ